jgi:dephospho-CoA kinase
MATGRKLKVVGLTGSIGSGKEVVKEFLARKYNMWYVSLSSMIRAELEKKKHSFNRMTLQDHGNELRRKYGSHILAKLAVEYLQRDKELIVVDGIRNIGEARWLKQQFGKDFVLIAVDAPQNVRFERIVARNRPSDPKSWEEFLEVDKRDQGEGEPEYGQHTGQCIREADFVIVNDGSKEEFEKKVIDVIENLWIEKID